MKKILLEFDDTTFDVLHEYLRRYYIINGLTVNPIISHDAENDELTGKLQTYLNDKICGILGYNFIVKSRIKSN